MANWRSGGGGTPGGADTQVQFNDAGVFGGDAGLTYDKTNDTLTVGGATVTTSNPVLNLSQTWNAGAVTFTGFKLNITNTASAAASLPVDIQVGGASVFSVRRDGFITNAAGASIGGQLSVFGRVDMSGWYGLVSGGNGSISLANGSGNRITWGSSTSDPTGANADTGLARKAAKIVEVNNGTSGTYAGTAFTTGAQTVAQLPAAGTAGAGARSFVTDANATTYASVVAGGGANTVPVYCDGTNWRIG